MAIRVDGLDCVGVRAIQADVASNIAALPPSVYSAVYNHLAHGNAFGIFPEGGSHDRPDLLPLKVRGVFVSGFVDV